MASGGGQGQQRELRNDTAVNVAGLLKAQTGASREYRLLLDSFDAGDGLAVRDVHGDLRLTRLNDGILARVEASGIAPLECARCLREYEQPFAIEFEEEFRQTFDVRTGLELTGDQEPDDDDLSSRIDENHELELREPLRQEILVALPMRPDCGDACPGPDVLETGADDGDVVDERLAGLARLLDDEPARETG